MSKNMTIAEGRAEAERRLDAPRECHCTGECLAPPYRCTDGVDPSMTREERIEHEMQMMRVFRGPFADEENVQ